MRASKKVKTKRQKLSILMCLLPFTFCLFFGACSSAPPPQLEFVVADSKSYEASLFRQNCAICHGQEANGKEINGKQIPSLRYGDASQRSEAEIYNQISNGKLPMPAFKNQLSDDEIKKMVRFVMRDLQGR